VITGPEHRPRLTGATPPRHRWSSSIRRPLVNLRPPLTRKCRARYEPSAVPGRSSSAADRPRPAGYVKGGYAIASRCPPGTLDPPDGTSKAARTREEWSPRTVSSSGSSSLPSALVVSLSIRGWPTTRTTPLAIGTSPAPHRRGEQPGHPFGVGWRHLGPAGGRRGRQLGRVVGRPAPHHGLLEGARQHRVDLTHCRGRHRPAAGTVRLMNGLVGAGSGPVAHAGPQRRLSPADALPAVAALAAAGPHPGIEGGRVDLMDHGPAEVGQDVAVDGAAVVGHGDRRDRPDLLAPLQPPLD
jgi:hypothetical protein